jgi:hypothetical protein
MSLPDDLAPEEEKELPSKTLLLAQKREMIVKTKKSSRPDSAKPPT